MKSTRNKCRPLAVVVPLAVWAGMGVLSDRVPVAVPPCDLRYPAMSASKDYRNT